jgi:hypothetical protein
VRRADVGEKRGWTLAGKPGGSARREILVLR